MKNIDLHKAFLQNENFLVIFTGKSTYVSGILSISGKKEINPYIVIPRNARI